MIRSGRSAVGGVVVLVALALAPAAKAAPGAVVPCSAGASCPPVMAKLLRAHAAAVAPAAEARAAVRSRAAEASGTLLAPCDDPPELLCGSIDVPLDRTNPSAGTIPIFFAVAPHTAPGPAEGTVLFADGGPGGSSTRLPILEVLYPDLMDTRDGLLIDRRGTGRSGAIGCPALQAGDPDLLGAVRACGTQLGGAAGDYGTRDVADDVDAVRAALGIDRLDYYGLSYGGLEVQAYAAHHGEHLRTAVLDAPYGLGIDDTFQSPVVDALVRELRLICGRSPSCHAADPFPGATLQRLLARVREAPVTGTASDADGNRHDVTVDEARVVNLLADSSAGFIGAAEISAAVRALDRGDPAPLLRLAAEQEPPPGGFPPPDPREFSVGDFFASVCTDFTFPFDRTQPEAVRRAQYDAAVAGLPERAFAPFSVGGWLGSFVPIGDQCVPWPPVAGPARAAGARRALARPGARALG